MPRVNPKPVAPLEVEPKEEQKEVKKAKAGKKARIIDVVERRVVHAKLRAEWYLGDEAIGEDMARQLLEWVEEDDHTTFGAGVPVLLKDYEGSSVACLANLNNRPLDVPAAYEYAQDVLNRRWADSRNGEGWTQNGESIIISRTGQVISGQKRLVGVVLANQIWRSFKQKDHWIDKWPEPPSIEALVVFGVSDLPEVVRTVDNVRARTLADVLFTNPSLWGETNRADRVRLCKMVQNCVRVLWDRTAAYADPYSPARTHSEALDFLDRHPHVVKAVKHVHDEYKRDWAVCCRHYPPGTAAALLYLMGASASDGERDGRTGQLHGYLNHDPAPAEVSSCVDFDNWPRAAEFWARLCKFVGKKANKPAQDQDMWNVWRALTRLMASEDGEGGGTLPEKTAVVVRGWQLFVEGAKVTEVALEPDEGGRRGGIQYLRDEHEKLVLDFYPDLGGLDVGPKRRKKKEDDTDDSADFDLPDEENGAVEEMPDGGPVEEEEPAPAPKRKKMTRKA